MNFRNISLLVFCFYYLFALFSCDKIEEPYMNDLNEADTTACPVPVFDNNFIPIKKILLEEFTGHKCPNCPNASIIAKNLVDVYGNKLIVMAIHSGFFALPDASGNFTADFTTASGDAIADNFNVILNPVGMVNRKLYNNNRVLNPGDWSSAIADIENETPQMYLQVQSQWSATDNDLCVHIKTHFLTNLNNTYNLVVQIVENDIVSPQKTNDPNYPSGYILDYVHSHVLRKTLSGTWGKELNGSSFEAGHTEIVSFKTTIDSTWQLNNCKIIAYVYDLSSDLIIQAEETDLLPN